ncbi:MAG: MarR family winged helix-turn-helix transcriptional regulator [Candidatus Dormibacteria bacterium]
MPDQTSSPAPDRADPRRSESLRLGDAARLRAAILRLGRELRATDVAGGLTPSEFSALAVVVRFGPLRTSALAHAEHLNPTMLSRMLARLSQTGMVRREGDERDGRVSLVAATENGRRLHQRLRAKRAGKLAAALDQLPEPERIRVLGALDGLESLVELLRPEVT